ncbi:MAG TPA: AraC family transcriptional regulator ligand-binding domain-containing protein [Myxococcota bacterium]|nr:AraC family transcriptional regulator ligand-binding domain-containing protein [Myxococcota bacterium]
MGRDDTGRRGAADLAETELILQLVEFGRERGADVAAVLAGLDLDADDIAVPDGYVDTEQWFRLQVGLADALDDPIFGLRLAEFHQLRHYGLLGVLYELSADVRSAIERLAKLLPQFLGRAEFELVDRGGDLEVSYRIDLPDRLTWVHRQEVIGGLVRNAGRASGLEQVKPIAVRLRQREAPAAELRAFFGVDVELGAEIDQVVLPAEVVGASCRTADPKMLKLVLDAVETQIARRRAWVGRTAARLRLEGCVVDLANGRVERAEGTVWLTSKERALLEFFAARPNQVVSHAEIEQNVWRLGTAVISHAPAVAVRRLRQKIEPSGSRPVNLVTMFGDGWKLVVKS